MDEDRLRAGTAGVAKFAEAARVAAESLKGAFDRFRPPAKEEDGDDAPTEKPV